jgi:hypothetical protein
MQDRRTDTRLLCADLIELIWCDPGGQEQRKVANLEDISPQGMSLQLESPVHVGTQVRVIYGEKELTGLIRYAIYRNHAYFVGVELDQNSRWSIRQFVPQHLLDPRGLVQRLSKPQAQAQRWVN